MGSGSTFRIIAAGLSASVLIGALSTAVFYLAAEYRLRIASSVANKSDRRIGNRFSSVASKSDKRLGNGFLSPIAASQASTLSVFDRQTPRRQLFVRVSEHKHRRMENQMFMYASLYGIALRSNKTPIWSETNLTMPVLNVFNISMMIDKESRLAKSNDSNFVKVGEHSPVIYDDRTERLPTSRNVTLNGFFQSRLYFQHVERRLGQEFTFRPASLNAAKSFVDKILPEAWKVEKDISLVAIHVRRGDMAKVDYVNNGWTQVGAPYFQRAMDYFNARHPRVFFIVLSDDLPWCHANIVGDHVAYSQGHSFGEDLAVASLCHHAIITLGTFGLWVAWFADGITVRPADVPRNGSKTFQSLKHATHYFPMNSMLL